MATNIKIMKEQAAFVVVFASNIILGVNSVLAEMELFDENKEVNDTTQFNISAAFTRTKIRGQSGACWGLATLVRDAKSYGSLSGWNNFRNLNVNYMEDRCVLVELWKKDLRLSLNLVRCLFDSINDFGKGLHSNEPKVAMTDVSNAAFHLYRELDRIQSIMTDFEYLAKKANKQKRRA
jgi:hypothetical protein